MDLTRSKCSCTEIYSFSKLKLSSNLSPNISQIGNDLAPSGNFFAEYWIQIWAKIMHQKAKPSEYEYH